jgi:CPA2 family monovalent cation:H+ antiporter-2
VRLSKTLSEQAQLHTPAGRQIMGVLLFQDLAVIPLLILIPALALPAEALAGAMVVALAKAVVVLAVVLVVGQRLMRPLFNLVARQKSSELFVLFVLLVTLGLAWVTELAGLSLALGAFLAGMLISETEYRYQVDDYIKPFRDVLLGFFFVTIGMLLDPGVIVGQWLRVAAVLVALLLAKFALVFVLARAFGNEKPTALYFVASEWTQRAMALHQLAVKTMATQGHVIVCGYGRSGQALARFLEREGLPVIALDADPERVRQAAAAGDSVVYGDASRREVLAAAALSRAVAVVVSFADTPRALVILSHVRQMRPELPVVVRTWDDTDVGKLREAGAAEIVAEVVEGSLMLATQTMMLLGVPLNRVLRRLREVRAERYHLMSGFFPGATDSDGESEAGQARLGSVMIGPSAARSR